MDFQSEIGTENLNILFDAALEFGEHWRRPLLEWARELLPELDASRQEGVSRYIEQVRDEIEDYVAARYNESAPEQMAAEEIRVWIRGSFPWMTEDNVRRAHSQAMYYAWHG
jgi:hypothetical protein